MKKDHPDVHIARICAYIDEHLTEELTYKQLMEQLQLNQHYLTGKFPRAMGSTVTDYIIKQRLKLVIAKAKKGIKLEDAAYSSGFHTYSHFYKEFRKNFGTSPRAYFSKNKK